MAADKTVEELLKKLPAGEFFTVKCGEWECGGKAEVLGLALKGSSVLKATRDKMPYKAAWEYDGRRMRYVIKVRSTPSLKKAIEQGGNLNGIIL